MRFRQKDTKLAKDASVTVNVWSRGVTRWFRCSLSVADSFVCRCLTSCTMLPSSHPAHRTGYADFPLPALGERVTMSPTGKVARPFGKADETQHVVQGCL
jgi:hypothetical protein